ncbi:MULTISPECIES: substrate-binding domain-containing protein [Clostridium]|uniref:PBP superfamily domain protein n=1 Tax=Clostridium ragsdalei P11 TaxID=1353534 RepID=A0A1A6AN32_9CLOT|nr:MULTISPECIES: substrate-binding domain-containing protein [Clostridium]OBR91471.1 PBP superfamily domain protein [Clostridium ragsdalei P11]OBR91553.1 PBP superfamily domain protein [Clostridium ragsdalei P11]QXE21109.1 tungsten ABC transporter substrate-binding protein [Clostridium sp. 001]
MKKKLALLLSLIFVFLVGCTTKQQEAAKPKEARSMVLATTTSTQDTGLLDYLVPLFKKDTGIDVKVVAKGTGEALKLAQNGDADCLLVHDKSKEEEFIKNGYGLKRNDVMYNDFIIVGPTEDPAKIKEKAYNNPIDALKIIKDSNVKFISRGDESGTHSKEKGLWKSAEITPSGSWYVSAGKGMGAVLQMADEMKAYTLTDRGTYLSMKNKLKLQIVTEKSPQLYNQYGVIKLNPAKNPKLKEKEADEFYNWILSDKIQKNIGEYGKDKYGQALFIPNAKK